ncbi:SCO family protein [Phocicoccus pinnipedialis]|uniref:SCO1 protein n=1 Tax=Phocicoccus pinnipedialis TaxID=110845 RepID=A0A6V7RGY3_9BACL|nr:SCO family protein [Jeotgalicoccus pinnipedialis]MBP1939189.1 protein SCO1/2 [Jeotgalicoccus pinnipedialis]CAD2076382.1 SCO1 protein [Jeotgalicoccus pinnipedialis]
MKKFLFLILSVSLLLAACNKSDVEVMSRYGNTMQEFSVTDQNDEIFTESDMDGKVWLVDFIFTNCATVCPPMTMNMTDVVNQLNDDGVTDFGVLSFSVDPETDSPQVLKEYMSYYEIPEDVEWKFVTGYDYDYIRHLAEKNFKTIVAPPPKGSNQVTHGTAFYLIDQNGKIIKDYSGVDNGNTSFPKEEIIKDVKTLTKSEQ